MGDFNVILFINDKIGGASGSLSKMVEFRECVFDCVLMDLRSIGLHYT